MSYSKGWQQIEGLTIEHGLVVVFNQSNPNDMKIAFRENRNQGYAILLCEWTKHDENGSCAPIVGWQERYTHFYPLPAEGPDEPRQ